MIKSSPVRYAIVLCVVAGCTGSDRANDDRPAQSARTAGSTPSPESTVELSGCLGTAPGTTQYALRSVMVENKASSASGTRLGSDAITEGAWVRLSGSEQELEKVAGHRIRVTGLVTDTGKGTTGTTGPSGVPTPSGDRSQAASPEHHSEKVKKEAGPIAQDSITPGRAPEIRVQRVQSTGERCSPPTERTR